MVTGGAVAYIGDYPEEHMAENRNRSKGSDTSE